MIRILLIDDHALAREALGRLLEDAHDLRVVGSFDEAAAAVVVEGNTSHQAARMLGLSPKSIDTYRSRLMTQLDIRHLPALVKFAIRRGLTGP